MDSELNDDILLMEQMEFWLKENYEFRYNELNKSVEIKMRDSDTPHCILTERRLSSIIRETQRDLNEYSKVSGMVKAYLGSEDIGMYNPIKDFLANLPEWDGIDHIASLFMRIPGIDKVHLGWMRKWFLSSVAHWLDMDTLHGNECVPLFVGGQGIGKTTYCRRLLPMELRPYYLDHFNFSNKFDRDMALTNNLFVSIDEFDQVKPSQLATLKFTLSKSRVNSRPIYGRAQMDYSRYASFIASTNNPHPLNDPTGSRRFICIRIPDGQYFDNDAPINYDQLYSQAVTELKNGERYWFNNEESSQIQEANAEFQSIQNIISMIEACFRHPKNDEMVRSLSVKEVMEILAKWFPTLETGRAMSIQIGLKLKELGYHKKMKADGSYYDVVEITPAWATE